jgi:hypothetical protein
MVQLQSIDRSVNQRSKKQAKLVIYATTMGSNALSSRILIQNHFVTHESFMQEYMKLQQGLPY